MNNVLELKNIDFRYKQSLVLNNISFNVKKGDFVGLIGPNGSGKTTLLKLILGILPLQKGSIFINNRSLSSFKDWQKIGYVPQKATNIESNFPATVKEVVAMGLLSMKRFPKFITKKDSLKVIQSLNLVQMGDFIDKRIGELSGGQQQRVLIAKAIISNPDILFLDEPTTGIDSDSQKKFYEILESLNKNGTTIMLVSHDVGRITKYVNKIASLNQKLEFYGSHKDFCLNDIRHSHDLGDHRLCLDKG